MIKFSFVIFSIVFCGAFAFAYILSRTFIDKYHSDSHVKPLGYSHSSGTREKLFDLGDISFVGNISIGTPPQYFTVLFDTGSPYFVISSAGCKQPINGTAVSAYTSEYSSTYKPNGTIFRIEYVTGGYDGYLSTDVLNIGGSRIAKQTFAEIEPFSDGSPYDGILGLGYRYEILTPLDSMFHQKLIGKKMFSLYINRNSSGYSQGGEIIFGDTDRTRYVGDLSYVPLITDTDWIINIEWFAVNNQSITNNTAAVVDTGSPLNAVPQDHFVAIYEAIGATSTPTNYTIDGSTITYYTVSCDNITNLPDVQFILNGKLFELQPTDYIVKSNVTECISAFATAGLSDWILGAPFLRQYYTEFDLENNRIGFAKVADNSD